MIFVNGADLIAPGNIFTLYVLLEFNCFKSFLIKFVNVLNADSSPTQRLNSSQTRLTSNQDKISSNNERMNKPQAANRVSKDRNFLEISSLMVISWHENGVNVYCGDLARGNCRTPC